MTNSAAWNRTKIVCTLGPATDAPGVLEALVRAGMNVARGLAHNGDPAVLVCASDPAQAAADSLRTVRLE